VTGSQDVHLDVSPPMPMPRMKRQMHSSATILQSQRNHLLSTVRLLLLGNAAAHKC
jgi:hypothetical protein